MKVTRKFFGAAVILALVSLVFWLPADLASTSTPSGQRNAISLQGAAQQKTPDGQFIASDPVAPVLTLAARDVPPPVNVPVLDREINPRMNFNAKVDPDFTVPGGPDPLLPLQEAAPPAQPDGFGTPIFNFNGQGYHLRQPAGHGRRHRRQPLRPNDQRHRCGRLQQDHRAR